MGHLSLTDEIEALLDRHDIAPQFKKHFHSLVEEGRIRSDQFHIRLRHIANYEAALYEILELLSRSCRHLFEPYSFQSLGVPHGN